MTQNEAREIMHSWTQSSALRTHMECVAACMQAFANLHEPDNIERWTIAGLLHDFDYEKHPTADKHPKAGVAWLKENTDLDDDLLQTILAHAPHTGAPRDTLMKQVIFAVDELAGFIVACAKVRPNGISDLKAKSVTKKLKDKSFAAAVSRDDIFLSMEELGADRASHIQFCINAIRDSTCLDN